MAKSKRSTKPQRQSKHPPGWEKDLNPDRLAGQNLGEQARLRSAADIKELTKGLEDFTNDELAQIPIVASGQRLEQGAVYIDLRNRTSGPMKATGDMTATESNLYVAKAETPYEYWNRLIDGISAAEETVDKTLEDSFPTSDPPAWTGGRERTKPGTPEAPREKRAEPKNR
jgi:hypothetical protein